MNTRVTMGAAMTAPIADQAPLSAECTLAQRPDYRGLHRDCRQTEDVPLPYGGGLLLVRRCGCSCHVYNHRSTPAPA